MSSTAIDLKVPKAAYVVVGKDRLIVELADGRVISSPLSWYPRLVQGNPKERNTWELTGRGIGIHWPDLDEDISVDGVLGGRRSMESAASFRRWLSYRARGQAVPVPELPLPPDMAALLESKSTSRNRRPARIGVRSALRTKA